MVITVHSHAGGWETMIIIMSSVFYHHSSEGASITTTFLRHFLSFFHGFPAPFLDSLAESTVITMLS